MKKIYIVLILAFNLLTADGMENECSIDIEIKLEDINKTLVLINKNYNNILNKSNIKQRDYLELRSLLNHISLNLTEKEKLKKECIKENKLKYLTQLKTEITKDISFIYTKELIRIEQLVTILGLIFFGLLIYFGFHGNKKYNDMENNIYRERIENKRELENLKKSTQKEINDVVKMSLEDFRLKLHRTIDSKVNEFKDQVNNISISTLDNYDSKLIQIDKNIINIKTELSMLKYSLENSNPPKEDENLPQDNEEGSGLEAILDDIIKGSKG